MFIVTDSENPFSYTIKSWSIITDPSDPLKDIKVTIKVYLNDSLIEDLTTSSKVDGDQICTETTIPLKGSKRYFLHYTREKIYNINFDYYIAFKAQYITKNLQVSMDLPSDIDALFIERGTTDDFITVKNSKNYIKKVYKGVILPKQGFIFALRNKASIN